MITRARAALGEGSATVMKPQAERLTLHEAMEPVLRENQNEWMTVRELAEAINERGLYAKRDGSLVDPSQIHARANNKYQAMFEQTRRRKRRFAGQPRVARPALEPGTRSVVLR